MRTVAFVPIKLNSERLPMKNVRSFTNGEPLIAYILATLKRVTNVDECYVYCSSDTIKPYIPDGIKFLKRDPYYDLPDTKFNEVLKSFARLVDADTYVLTHATAPFINAESIEEGIRKVNIEGYDSAFAVRPLQEFLWKDNKPYNYDLRSIPRTQDLDKLYKESCGLYVYQKSLIEQGKRIGENPFLLQITEIEACDINTEEDFYLADAIYNYKRIRGELQ